MFTARIFFRGLRIAFSNARIQPLRKVRILIVSTFKLLSFCIIMHTGALERIVGEVYGNKRIE